MLTKMITSRTSLEPKSYLYFHNDSEDATVQYKTKQRIIKNKSRSLPLCVNIMRQSSSMTLVWYEHNLFTVTHISFQIGVDVDILFGKIFYSFE